MSSDSIVVAFVRDLFPYQQAAPEAVADGIAKHCSVDQHRNEATEIREVVRTAGEWRGALMPPKQLFKAAPPRATEEDFMLAARRAFDQYG